jgi:putative pyruvate formate lyase activating enzyme
MVSYLDKLTQSELKSRSEQLRELTRECILCPRQCKAKRLDGKFGVCRTTNRISISSASPHYGEEAPLVGKHGSGTIFFSSCNLKCLYCQNFQISHLREGKEITTAQLADIMLQLQNCGCHNINFVTPTHVISNIVEALTIAVQKGLRLPLVYNCGGYESVHTLELLDGIIDIYMPDIKYADNATAKKYSGAKDYWDVVRPAIQEMHRQVGTLMINDDGVAESGLLIRHLVLPNRLADSEKVLQFIAKEISAESYVNIMDQYHPAFRAWRIPELGRPIAKVEHEVAVGHARELGLHRGF